MNHLDGLYGPLVDRLTRVRAEMMAAGFNVDLAAGLRTWEEQDKLYALGRTVINPDGRSDLRPHGTVVTKARGGQSWHNYGLAADIAFVPHPDMGSLSWSEAWPWKRLGEVGQSFGLVWGGCWHFLDLPHFELTAGLTLPQAQVSYQAGGVKAVWAAVADQLARAV